MMKHISERQYKGIKYTTMATLVAGAVLLTAVSAQQYLSLRDSSGTSVEIASVSADNLKKTVVLDATSETDLSFKSVELQTNGEYYLEIVNNKTVTQDFSPGLQVFGLSPSGQEVTISTLGQDKPLMGGPILAGGTSSGVVKFANGGIVGIRMYSPAGGSSFIDIKL